MGVRPSGRLCLSDLTFAEQMHIIITYKSRGKYPFPKMSRSAKSDLRRKAKSFTLLDNGVLMKIDRKEGVPTGKLRNWRLIMLHLM